MISTTYTILIIIAIVVILVMLAYYRRQGFTNSNLYVPKEFRIEQKYIQNKIQGYHKPWKSTKFWEVDKKTNNIIIQEEDN